MNRPNSVQSWDEHQLGTMSLEAIRAHHRPTGRYRISLKTYPAGVAFEGTSRARRVYVLNGACTFDVKGTTWDLHAGDMVDLSEGTYSFRVPDASAVDTVSVWELPEPFWPAETDDLMTSEI